MDVAAAQREVRSIYLGGYFGQLVSGTLWLVSAAFATWMSQRAGIFVLVLGGFAIFPLTQLLLLVTGRPASLTDKNPLRELAIEIAFLVPLLLPLVGAATAYHGSWFYPSMMIVVGAHYLPFSFLYGMREFLILSGSLLFAGIFFGLYAPHFAVYGCWLTGITLCVFAFVGKSAALRS